MTNQTQETRGIFLVASFAALLEDTSNAEYKNVLVRLDDIYAPVRFSVRAGSELDIFFSGLDTGELITLSTSIPSIQVSKAGNKYQRWFLLAAEKAE